jgi:hypothetical protein
MSNYPAFICENGHVISAESRECNKKFCRACGKPIISTCRVCGSLIPGRPVHEYTWGAPYVAPTYCEKCGKPYPWLTAAIEATLLAIKESKDFSQAEIQQIETILPDVVIETPKTQLAAVRIKNAIEKGKGFAANILKQFVIDFGCDLILQFLGIS